ncbi:MAG: hypothetical protein Fur0019_07220 [Tibeticola sp.]
MVERALAIGLGAQARSAGPVVPGSRANIGEPWLTNRAGRGARPGTAGAAGSADSDGAEGIVESPVLRGFGWPRRQPVVTAISPSMASG